MVRRERASFHSERTRLLHRTRTAEFWEGAVDGKPAILKRFAGSHESNWREFVLQSRIQHSLLLPASQAGIGPGGRFAYAMPADFAPSKVTTVPDPAAFATQILSLVLSLRSRGMSFRWDPQLILEDRETGKVYLPAVSVAAEKGSSAARDCETKLFADIRGCAEESPGSSDLEKILKKWERRKENRVEGCLQDLMQRRAPCLESLPAWFEIPRTKELELTGGLLQLARQCRGRALLFQSDPGGGKSSLLAQLYRDFLLRNVDVFLYQAPPETRSYYSIRRLLAGFMEHLGGRDVFRGEFASARRAGSTQNPLDVPEEALVADFLRLMEKVRGNSERAFVILVDDLDGFDTQSLSVVARVLQGMHASPLLFVATCTRKLEHLPDAVLTLPLEELPAEALEESCVLPLWKPEQKRETIRRLEQQTAGNMLLFREAFAQILTGGAGSMRWDGSEWSLGRLERPRIPDSVASLYFRKASELSDRETRLLEDGAVQGCVFDPRWIDQEPSVRMAVLHSLHGKGILAQSGDCWRFLRPVLAAYFYDRMDDRRKKDLHRQLAGLLEPDSSGKSAGIAHHYLRAGCFDEALDHACRAAREIRFNTAQLVLPILDELQLFAHELDRSQNLRLRWQKAELLFLWGKYPAAAESYSEAILLVDEDPEARFDLQVRIAECRFQSNDIHGALQALKDAEENLAFIRRPELLIRFYFCRGNCGWQRGNREKQDFEKALALAEEHQDLEALAGGHRRLAELALREGALTEARTLAARALRFARRAGSCAESGHALRILGMVAWHRSLHHTAVKILRRSIRSFSRAGSIDGVARAWSLLGNVSIERCRFREAIAAFQKASALFSQLDHPLEVSLAQFNLGLVYMEQGRLKEAERIYQRCKAMDRKTGNKRYYAFDLRALAVVSILRGCYRKAVSLLNRTLEICEELHAEGDVLQTRMIQLMNELEQKNYRQAQPLAVWLEQQLESLQEPMARAEIQYLLGHYHGYINETEKALKHLQESMRLSRKIRYYKLIGMSLMLKLVFRNVLPGRKDRDLARALSCFRKSSNELRLSDYLLKLYQAYPVLLREREHSVRLSKMERLYRQIRHRPNHRLVRQLAAGQSARGIAPEPLYDWWQSVLQSVHGEGELEPRLRRTMALLAEELHATAVGLWFRNGAMARFHFPAEPLHETSIDFHEQIWKRVQVRKEPLSVEITDEPELTGHAWAQLHDIRSVMAVPLLQDGRLLGVWYFERWGLEPAFTQKELGKAGFFAMASLPALVYAMQQAGPAERDAQPGRADSDFIGKSDGVMAMQRQILRLSPLDISVLILGESGTGKELIARSLHRNSPRAQHPFLAVNCSAIPETLVESELFGYAKGAFTGASMTRQGYIERANCGTLFLDEIGDLSLAAQAKLLRVMQEREIQRLGETTPRRIDVRFVFATHKDVKKMIREGTFREDLFYRISVYSLCVPPLRDRSEDIPLLLNHFTGKYAQSFSRGKIQYTPAAMQALCDYAWPGNVREMENAVQSLLVNAEAGGRIDLKDLPVQIVSRTSVLPAAGVTLEEARQEFEREFLKQALKRNSWNKTRTARELGVTRQGLIQMIQRLGLGDQG